MCFFLPLCFRPVLSCACPASYLLHWAIKQVLDMRMRSALTCVSVSSRPSISALDNRATSQALIMKPRKRPRNEQKRANVNPRPMTADATEHAILAILDERWNPAGGSAKEPRTEFLCLFEEGRQEIWRPARDVFDSVALLDYERREAREGVRDVIDRKAWDCIDSIIGKRYRDGIPELQVRWKAQESGRPQWLHYEELLGSEHLLQWYASNRMHAHEDSGRPKPCQSVQSA